MARRDSSTYLLLCCFALLATAVATDSDEDPAPEADEPAPAPEPSVVPEQDVYVLRLIKEQFDKKCDEMECRYKELVAKLMLRGCGWGQHSEVARAIMFEALPYDDCDEFWDWIREQGANPDGVFFQYQTAEHRITLDELNGFTSSRFTFKVLGKL
eukprot:SAG31_NODE_1465_length_8232_cov_31.250830_3_plen_156_part_00